MSKPTPASSPFASPVISTSTSSSHLSSATESLTSSILNTLSTALISPTPSDTLPLPSISPQPPSSNDGHSGKNQIELLCDWTRTASNCRDSEFTKIILVASSAAHLMVVFVGLWLLYYRNRGFNSKVVTDLFVKVGTGLRPKPMDCIIFFTTIASLVKIVGNLILVFDALLGHIWFRVAVEQMYWVILAFGFSAYFVGLLYAMPVTTREGIFAVYQPEVVYGSKPLRAIHVLTPTTVQKNVVLIMGAVYPSIFGAGLGIASGALQDHGYMDTSHVLMLLQYSNWVLILWSMAIMFFYYGLKYTFILRANIIIAEAALKAPRAAFGLGNLKSRSPARFLFIQLQITGFGGSAITVLAGALCMLWVLFKPKILRMENAILPHIMAIFWTCLIALAYLIFMGLIGAQSIRSRRRGLHEPSTTTASQSLSRSKSSNKPAKSTQVDHPVGGGLGGASDSEARLTQPSLEELGMYRAGVEKDSLDLSHPYQPDTALQDLSQVRHREAATMDRDLWRPTSPSSTTPAAHPRIGIHGGNGHGIRESVFGGRTPREEPMLVSPTTGQTVGFAFPLKSMLSGTKASSAQPRPSTSSTTQTTSGSSHRLSLGSSKHGSSSNSDTQQLPLPPNYDSLNPTMNPLELQQETERQLQQLQQGSGPGCQPSSQRTRVQPIPEDYDSRPSSRASELPSFIQHQLSPAPSSPPASPTRSGSLRSIPSPIITAVMSHQHQAALARDERFPSPLIAEMSTTSPTASTRSIPQQNLQLQQQHPLHQVAFKGLSPPPRSPPSAATGSTITPGSPTRRTMTPSPGLAAISTTPGMMAPYSMPAPPSPTILGGSGGQRQYPRSYQSRTAGDEELTGENTSPRMFPVGYNEPLQQTVPRMGGAVRRASNHSNKDKDSSRVSPHPGSRLPSSPPMLPQMYSSSPSTHSVSGGYPHYNNNTTDPTSFTAIHGLPEQTSFTTMGLPMPPSALLHRLPMQHGLGNGPSQQELDQLPMPPPPLPLAPSSSQKMEYIDPELHDHHLRGKDSHYRTDNIRRSMDSSGDEMWPLPPTSK